MASRWGGVGEGPTASFLNFRLSENVLPKAKRLGLEVSILDKFRGKIVNFEACIFSAGNCSCMPRAFLAHDAIVDKNWCLIVSPVL